MIPPINKKRLLPYFPKIEAGSLELEAVRFKLQGVLDHVVDLFAEKASDKDLDFLASLAPEVPLSKLRAGLDDPASLARLAEVASCMDSYDFPAALKVLDQLRR